LSEVIYDEDGNAFEVLDEQAVIAQYEAQRAADAEAWLESASHLIDVAEKAAQRRLTNREIEEVIFNYEEGGLDAAADAVADLPSLDSDVDRRAYVSERLGQDPGYSSAQDPRWGGPEAAPTDDDGDEGEDGGYEE
jgi:hypothetical protein